ncbi:MAG: metallophosphoesterase family protein [bacterium]|nr:metallophosphoesterase family protein [bacterium]
MLVAFYSDVHSNLEALTAVLDDMGRHRPDQILFGGDAVGYGPNPNECLERIFAVSHAMVAGNHDHAAADLFDSALFNPFARDAILWTRSVLTPENRRRIASMPLTASTKEVFVVHGSPEAPGDWDYLHSAADAAHQFEFFTEKLCVVGHTHRPAIYMKDGEKIVKGPESMLTFEERFRYIVNVGSVGQPRDGNRDALYALYETGERTLSFHRVAYDYRATQEKMRAAHLPSFLIDRLESGT